MTFRISTAASIFPDWDRDKKYHAEKTKQLNNPKLPANHRDADSHEMNIIL